MIKFPSFALTSLLVLALVQEQAHHVKAATCFFSTSFGSGDNLAQISNEVFQAAPDAQTVCTFTCSSVGTTQGTTLWLKYGGGAGPQANDVSGSYTTGCNLSLSLTSASYVKVLGYRLEVNQFSDLTMTCQCDNAGVDTSCFSADMTVEVQGHDEPISIKDLEVGDMVKSVSGYQQVYSFGHRNETRTSSFIQLHTEPDKAPLELSKEHFVFVDETSYLFGFWPQQKAIRADKVKVGDVLLFSGSKSPQKATVTAIDTVTKQGAYMPLTPDGTILVNGIQASTYVSIADHTTKNTLDNFAYYQYSEQNLNQWWLSPYRLLCMGVSSKFCSTNPNMMVSEEEDADVSGVLKWLIMGRSYAQHANDMSFFMQHVFAIPTALFFGFFLLTEQIFGPSMAPTALAALISLVIWRIRQNVVNGQKLKKE